MRFAESSKGFIQSIIKNSPQNEKELLRAKKLFARTCSDGVLANIDLLHAYRKLVEEGEIDKNPSLEKLLRRRHVRSQSGVSVVSILTKPYPCRGGCVYCPTEIKEGKLSMPKSYLSNEPAAMRAALNHFDPFLQVQNRLSSLIVTGHAPSKVEIIVIGGTFSFLPRRYATRFLAKTYTALNTEISMDDIKTVGKKGLFRVIAFSQKPEQKDSLQTAMNHNETAAHRCVGLTLETRPDTITPDEIRYFRRLGCTRVEMGVQTLDDVIQKKTQRGHTTKDVVLATRLLKDVGIKIAYHLMPNLPGSTPKKDIQQAQQVFADSRFRPDLIKFYPCIVTEEAELAQWWRKGLYTPYDEKTLSKILLESKKAVPKYCRITRLIRDIPAESILAGSKVSNLRQILAEQIKKEQWKCQCIRCREIRDEEYEKKNVQLCRFNYDASEGKEVFLSFEETKKDKLLALLRLRLPSSVLKGERHFIRALQGAAIIREVHTYGEQVDIGSSEGEVQHRGFGRKMLEEAERIAIKEWNLKKIAVIAGVGVRKYYEKFGYKEEGTYMVKRV